MMRTIQEPAATGEGGRLPRVLVFAFYCSPCRGSEFAAGWAIAGVLGDVAHVTVLVHPASHADIAGWEDEHGVLPGVTFVEVPEVRWGRRAQDRIRPLARHIWRLRYLGWLHEARRAAEELDADRAFDAVVHATPGTYWLPSTVVDLRAPSVWGPVGGAATSPPRLWPYLGIAGLLEEVAEQAIVRTVSRTPWVRRTWTRADVRLVETTSALARLPRALQDGTRVVNRSVLVGAAVPGQATPVPGLVVFPSQLESRKAPRLALRALRYADAHVRLAFLNEGPEEPTLRRLARRWGLEDRVEFRGRVPREELFAALRAACASLHVGLREEGGAALAEAMLCGVPVVVLGHGGARDVAEANTDPSRVAVVDPGGVVDTARRIGEQMSRFAADPVATREGYLDQEAARLALVAAVRGAAAG